MTSTPNMSTTPIPPPGSAATAERELDAMADQRKCAKKQAA